MTCSYWLDRTYVPWSSETNPSMLLGWTLNFWTWQFLFDHVAHNRIYFFPKGRFDVYFQSTAYEAFWCVHLLSEKTIIIEDHSRHLPHIRWCGLIVHWSNRCNRWGCPAHFVPKFLIASTWGCLRTRLMIKDEDPFPTGLVFGTSYLVASNTRIYVVMFSSGTIDKLYGAKTALASICEFWGRTAKCSLCPPL